MLQKLFKLHFVTLGDYLRRRGPLITLNPPVLLNLTDSDLESACFCYQGLCASIDILPSLPVLSVILPLVNVGARLGHVFSSCADPANNLDGHFNALHYVCWRAALL